MYTFIDFSLKWLVERSFRSTSTPFSGELTDDAQLGVGVFDAPVVFSDALVHAGVVEGETGELELTFTILSR